MRHNICITPKLSIASRLSWTRWSIGRRLEALAPQLLLAYES
jgi:hypothetical protein